MARSLDELENIQLATKAGLSRLDGLDSTSDTSYWGLKLYVHRFLSWMQETVFDRHVEEVQEIANRAESGVTKWYQEECLKFQYGDDLVYIDRRYQYAPIDETKQIVQLAAVTEGGGQVRIKVAKLDDATPIPLEPVELAAFAGYIEKIKIAGTYIELTSYAADDLQIACEIYYDPIIPLPQIKAAIIEAAENYVKNLPFDGILTLQDLVDAMQVVEGNPIINLLGVQARVGVDPFETIEVKYNAQAGYLEITPTSSIYNDLSYIPNV
jgi:hypothetical protein